MIDASRRTFLGAGAVLPLAATAARAAGPDETPPSAAGIEADLLRYVGHGEKRAGGAGDAACGEWLSGELEKAGFAVERQTFSAPFFEATRAELTSNGRTVPVYPQPSCGPPAPTA